jgi:LysR family transcriptional regulator, carnitine catabolism transcriptional activator
VPSSVLAECLRHGLHVSVLVKSAVHIDLFVVSRRGIRLKPAAQDFAAALKRMARQLPDLQKAG